MFILDPDPGSRGQKVTEILVTDPQHCTQGRPEFFFNSYFGLRFCGSWLVLKKLVSFNKLHNPRIDRQERAPEGSSSTCRWRPPGRPAGARVARGGGWCACPAQTPPPRTAAARTHCAPGAASGSPARLARDKNQCMYPHLSMDIHGLDINHACSDLTNPR